VRLGLIGLGPQGKRYLEERNGGAHIVTSGSRSIDLSQVDGVIIATHPRAHRELALECIAAGKAVLIEKPLALNLADCEEILEAASAKGVACEVAHTHLWSSAWTPPRPCRNAKAVAVYVSHQRDYSPWLDWAPHCIALVADACPHYSAGMLREHVGVEQHPRVRGVIVNADKFHFNGEPGKGETAIARMLWAFRFNQGVLASNYWAIRNHFNRRVYRALFAKEDTWQQQTTETQP
jgi:hypothetical protein